MESLTKDPDQLMREGARRAKQDTELTRAMVDHALMLPFSRFLVQQVRHEFKIGAICLSSHSDPVIKPLLFAFEQDQYLETTPQTLRAIESQVREACRPKLEWRQRLGIPNPVDLAQWDQEVKIPTPNEKTS